MTPQSSSANPLSADKFVNEAVSKLHEATHKNLLEAENYVRRSPGQAVLYSILAGYLLRFSPFVALLRALAFILIASVRPLILACGLIKIYELFKSGAESNGDKIEA